MKNNKTKERLTVTQQQKKFYLQVFWLFTIVHVVLYFLDDKVNVGTTMGIPTSLAAYLNYCTQEKIEALEKQIDDLKKQQPPQQPLTATKSDVTH